MSRFTQFLDIAGRPSRSDKSPFIVSAAVAFPTHDIAGIKASYTPPSTQWSSAEPAEARNQIGFVLEHATAAVVFRVQKSSPAWQDFWQEADRYHDEMARIEQRRVGFVKAGTLLRYLLFGEASARVMGDSVRLTGQPRILSQYGLGLVESSVICDSDIQGKENVEVFQWLFEQIDERPQPLLARFGIHHYVRESRLETEQSESLLYLPDYLAGLYQSCPSDLSSFAAEVADHEKVALVDSKFDVAYESIFGGTGLGRMLWPDV